MNNLKKIPLKISDLEITDIFFALSLFASFSTYFRFSALPIGLFEITNILFITFGFKRNLFQFNTPYIKHVAYWWGVFFLSSIIASVLLFSLKSRPYLFHDLMAYIYSGILSIFYISYKRPLYKIIIYTLGIVFFFLIIAFCIGDFYTANNRFIGFSKNPNQLGLCFSILPYLVMSQIKKDVFNKIVVFITLGCVILSFYSRSNSQILSYLFIPLFLLYKKYDKDQLSKFLGGAFILLVMLVGYGAFSGIHEATREILPSAVYNELFIRFEIWGAYLSEFINFPLGCGLGTIILIPKTIVNKYLNANLEAMFFDPHNSFINYLYVAGVIPTYLLAKKISSILFTFYTENKLALFFGFLSILLVMLFHNFTRQPILYFYLIYFIKGHYYLKLRKDDDPVI